MQFTTIGCGVLLILVGILGYANAGTVHLDTPSAEATSDSATPPAPGGKSITALIPMFVGVPLVLLGVLALNERFRKHAMHLAAMIGLLGAIGAGVRGIPNLAPLLRGDLPQGKVNATIAQLIMTVICAAFVALCINSFIEARRRRQANAGSTMPLG